MKICFTPAAAQLALGGAGEEWSIGLIPLQAVPQAADFAVLAKARRLTDRLVVAQVGPTPWLNTPAQQALQQAGVDVVLALPALHPPVLANATPVAVDLSSLLRAVLAVLPQSVWVSQGQTALIGGSQELLRAFPGLYSLEIVAPPL